MKNLGAILHPKDIVTKEYVDGALIEKASKAEVIPKFSNEDGALTGRVVTVAEDGFLVASEYSLSAATSDTLGLVRSSSNQNEISITEDGIMQLNSVSVSKLVQDEGEELVLISDSENI